MGEPSPVDKQVLDGWTKSTLAGYNSAVRKFLFFTRERDSVPFVLPASAGNIQEFCAWAGRGPNSGGKPVLATTLSKYLCGLRAWHLFHDQPYPTEANKKTTLILKASAKEDAKEAARVPKGATMIGDLIRLAEALTGGPAQDLAVLDMALVAFWSCARLLEVTYNLAGVPGNGGLGVLLRDVEWGPENLWACITLREAKTLSPGELQYLRVSEINDCLCPVAALRRLASSCLDSIAPLFGYQAQGERVRLTRYMLTTRLGKVWQDTSRPLLSGHSFHAGGASFLHAMKVAAADICTAAPPTHPSAACGGTDGEGESGWLDATAPSFVYHSSSYS
ncbi:hypothetical protein PCASD_07028 [Puccinia coronata f. sp. avenae]|uniref:Core-binding (CB) domain-containing protein n=1 Tax=Puccinia coronata f. sp. avenae TaxID=200324 RepID=A0A2N5UZW9_9BASI|nr:hypothetical protein PCASD_07028 [Puccinia coronata f. sp. avenae]